MQITFLFEASLEDSLQNSRRTEGKWKNSCSKEALKPFSRIQKTKRPDKGGARFRCQGNGQWFLLFYFLFGDCSFLGLKMQQQRTANDDDKTEERWWQPRRQPPSKKSGWSFLLGSSGYSLSAGNATLASSIFLACLFAVFFCMHACSKVSSNLRGEEAKVNYNSFNRAIMGLTLKPRWQGSVGKLANISEVSCSVLKQATNKNVKLKQFGMKLWFIFPRCNLP